MSSSGGVGDALVALYRFGVVALTIAVPLAIWKLVEIAIWLWNNVHVTVGK